jgi:predicted dehydrogenase
MSDQPVKCGIIGCGSISHLYFNAGKLFNAIEITACADLDMERARAKAEEHGVPKACTVDELLADPEIDIVLNLTVPGVHAEVDLRCLEAGKHVYAEKPLAVTRADGAAVLERAQQLNLRVGSAADTFLGAGGQTCRKLIDEGAIGEPVAATAFMMGHGHESWHPSPEFYYEKGGGPLFDMGPYYLSALVNLIGPVTRVSSSTRITFPERTITSEPKRGKVIKVETPTHLAGTLDFQNGAVGTVVMSFDVWKQTHPGIEVYGTEGSMFVPNPNSFGGPVRIAKAGEKEWTEVDLTHGYEEQSRGIGVADMANAIRSGREHRASGALALHVLDVMEAFLTSAEAGRHMDVSGTAVPRPEPLPVGLAHGEVPA